MAANPRHGGNHGIDLVFRSTSGSSKLGVKAGELVVVEAKSGMSLKSLGKTLFNGRQGSQKWIVANPNLYLRSPNATASGKAVATQVLAQYKANGGTIKSYLTLAKSKKLYELIPDGNFVQKFRSLLL